jgi:predicted glycosyltransferase
LRGEVASTLAMLKAKGVPLVLGLRDVMDDPALLEPEWKRKNVLPALRDLYDAIWIYGLPQICDPLAGITLPKSVKRKISYTGYLRRSVPASVKVDPLEGFSGAPYVLVTPGGGGDGEALIDWVLRAYESDAGLPHNALIVFGPFMQPELQAEFMQRVERLDRVRALTFDTRLETLMVGAAGVVAMGGYNTFCEILSFDKRAILVPRTAPRLEQSIRAQQAQEIGLVRMLAADGARDTRAMVSALRALPFQPVPSEVVVPGLLDGLGNVGRLAARWLDEKPRLLARPRLAFSRG